MTKTLPQAPPRQGFLPKKVEEDRSGGQHQQNNLIDFEPQECQALSGSSDSAGIQSLSVSVMRKKSDFTRGGSPAYPVDFSDGVARFDSLRSEPQLDFIV